MIYLTYNDQPSGVYSSQVSDVCNFLNQHLNARIRLVAFISAHNFTVNRKRIRHEFQNAWVFPALPKASYPAFSKFLFVIMCLFTGEKIVISRNIIATQIALFAKKAGVIHTVCLDGRGAIAAEWNEYDVIPDEKLKKSIHQLEKIAVTHSDFRISVSSKLVEHWHKTYGYSGDRHVVIPCTLNSGFVPVEFTPGHLEQLRSKAGYGPDDIVMVYSGSTAGWQSFEILGKKLGEVLDNDPNCKLLFLAKEDDSINRMKRLYPLQVTSKWVKHHEVQEVLSACDYGILYREASITNQVASPTKFAEYLSAGLPVIISENLGDYSDFVLREKCGFVVGENDSIVLSKPSLEQKLSMSALAVSVFTKEANISHYQKLIDFLNNTK